MIRWCHGAKSGEAYRALTEREKRSHDELSSLLRSLLAAPI